MIYLNDLIGAAGGLFPDLYVATSVSDYLKNKNKIPTPSLAKFLNPLMWLQGRLAYVKFSNVNLEPASDLDLWRYRISDLTGDFIVDAAEPQWSVHKSARLDNLQFGRQYELKIIQWFWPENGRLDLAWVNKHGPLEPHRDFEMRLGLATQLQPYR